jgi:hypothetical protein
MSELEQRITVTLASHDEFTYDVEHKETICAGCGWAITNVLDPDQAGLFRERKRAHQAQRIAAAIEEIKRQEL